MQIVYEYVGISARDTLEILIEKKLNNLEDKYPFIIRGDVFLKKENTKNGQGNIVDIRLSLKGPRIFASSNEDSYEKALSNTIDDLEDQLRKKKTQMLKRMSS